jgi:hypothetical protein
MSSLTNIPINARSMNGLITISDGTAVIEDGNITTTGDLQVDNLLCSTFSTQNMLVNYMQILRDSNPTVNAALGFTVDIGLLVQNMIFNDITRLYQIWNDTATAALLQVDVSNNFIDFGGTARFNSFLPTSVLTPTTNTQLITKVFADTTYGRLAVANTFTQLNTFSLGIVPRRQFGTGTDYQISPNSMANRQGGSTNNIGIGISTLEGDNVSAGYFYNTGSRNTACGHFALQKLDGGNDSVAIGYQALQNAGGQRIYGAGITPNRCVAIGSGSQKVNLYGSDNISIGFNSLSNVGSGASNIIIGSNVGGGLTNAGSCVVIGSGAMPTAVDNGIVAIGLNALRFATGQCNRGVFIGQSAGQSNNNGNANTFIGGESGTANTSGSQGVCIGTFAGRLSSSTGNYMVCIGYDSKAIQSNEFVLGGETFTERAELTLPNKTRLACNQSPTGVTINLSFRSNENVQLTDATTTTINLPSPTNASVGTKFYINRQVTGVSININAPAGQTLRLNQLNGTSIILSPYIMKAGMTNLTLLCIGSTAGGTNWQVLLPSIANGADELYLSTVIPIPTLNYSIPFGGLTSTDYQPMFMDNADLNFQPSTGTLSTQNLLVSSITVSNLLLNNKYTLGAQYATPISGTVNLSFNDPEYLILEASPVVTNITLPLPVLTSNIGTKFTIVNRGANLSRTVTAFTGEFIYDFNTQQTTNTFSLDKKGIAEFLCVGLSSTSTTTWVVLNRDDNMVLTGNIAQTITGDKAFSNNVSTANLVSTGEFKGKQFMYQSQNNHIIGDTTLTNPLFSYYTFASKTAAQITITLPEITASNVGTLITFKRLGGSLQIMRITATGAQPYFALTNALGTMTQTNTLITNAQNCAQIVAIVSQQAVSNCGQFSNTAGSTTINITIQNSGWITIGGRLNLFGNIRHVTAFGTGNGGTGTYTVDSALPVNVNQFYSQILSYGWAVQSCQ